MRTVNWREMTSHGWEVEHPKSAHFGLGTGMKDQAGMEIFEGDILQAGVRRGRVFRMVVRFGRHEQPNSDGDGQFFLSFIAAFLLVHLRAASFAPHRKLVPALFGLFR